MWSSVWGELSTCWSALGHSQLEVGFGGGGGGAVVLGGGQDMCPAFKLYMLQFSMFPGWASCTPGLAGHTGGT
jgi:hypothetical protein